MTMKLERGLRLLAVLGTVGGLTGGAALADAAKTPTGDPIAVPSGLEVRWLDTISDTQGPDGLTMRFRFIAPALAGKKLPEAKVAKDMETLCNSFALPRIAKSGPQPAQIVISLADKAVAFGQADEKATQYFEAYSIKDGACVMELF